jgi:hypothetical protein
VDDHEVLSYISKLVEEERELRANVKPGVGLAEPGRTRMRELEVQLDQCWDLLRRRKDREEYGENPDLEEVRPADVVENYKQ